MLSIIKTLWSYRGFIGGSIKREFQSKYRKSLLGALWNILNPLAMILVYTVIFAEVMRSRLPGVANSYGYSIFLCAGTLTWGYFAEIVTRAQNVFIENASLIKKLNFPRLCLPAIIIGNASLNFIIIFGLFLIFLIFSGNFPGITIIATLPLILLMILFSIGLGITLGVLNVFFRDVGQFFGIVMTFWFWLTPIVYPITALSGQTRRLLLWNPMTNIIISFQNIFVHKQWPEWSSLWPLTMLTVFFCFMGMSLFRSHAGEMVDEL